MTVFLFVLICATVILCYIKDYINGLLTGIFFLIVLPETMGLKINEIAPVLTLQRAVLIIMVLFWIKNYKHRNLREAPFLYLFLLIIIANTVSLVLSDYFVVSLKSYISLIIENILIYLLLYTSLEEQKDFRRFFLVVFNAITFIAVIGLIERWTEFHLLEVLPHFNERVNYYATGRILVNFKHPILLGISMAIGLILSLYFLSQEKNLGKRILLYLRLLVIGACLYFSFSRGPWLAAILGSGVLFLFGTKNVKSKVLIMAVLAMSILIIKPGTYEYLYNRYLTTFNPQTIEGSSYYYRWELWKKAYEEISKEPKRIVFGYGLEYHQNADLTDEFKLANKTVKFWSWDNELACQLLEIGFLGLLLYLFLYFRILARIFKRIRSLGSTDNFLLMNLSIILIVLFMMTNVKMFSQQVMYIFYSTIAISVKISSKRYLPAPGRL